MYFLSKAITLGEAIDMILEELNADYEATGDLEIKEKLSAIKYYKKSIFNKSLIATHRTEFNGLYTAIDKGIPDMTFRLDGNKKALKSFWEKLEMQQNKHQSIDTVYKDIHRFRLISQNANTDTYETIKKLYDAAVITIEYFLAKEYTLCKPNEIKDIKNFKASEHPEIFVPEKQLVPTIYKQRIKDYVFTPKKNGYQSIHLFFSKEDDLFEVQLRTFAMHIAAEYTNAAHDEFKQKTRTVHDWDYSKININGFKYVEIRDPETNEIIKREILDNVGIINPVETFVRRKTF